MGKQSLEDVDYLRIKEHILNPESTSLIPQHQEQLERVQSATKILAENPIQKHAVQFLMAKHPGLSIAQAYRDVALAKRLFNLDQKFDYVFWHTWALNDVSLTIQECRMHPNDEKFMKVRVLAQANLIKLLGEKPVDNIDPKLMEKNTFIIPIQVNNTVMNIDMRKWMKLDPAIKQEITKALYGSEEIDDVAAEEIMNS